MSSFVHISWHLSDLYGFWSGEGEWVFEARFTAETWLWCGKSVTFRIKNKKPVSHLWNNTGLGKKKKKKKKKKKHSLDSLKCRFCRSDWYRFECWPPYTVKKPFNPLSIFTVDKMESSAYICGPKCAFRSNFGHFEPKNLKKKRSIFSYKNGDMLPRTNIEFSRLTIIECFSLF